MANKTSIEWTEQTWNPIVGCSIVSPGCTNCYAMKMAARIEAMSESIYDKGERTAPAQYCGTTKKVNGSAVWTGKIGKAPNKTWYAPIDRKKPTTYFVNSMGDLFHEDAPDEWILDALTVMAICRQHTFQVLTKRAGRMREFMSRPDLLEQIYLNWYSFSGGAREVTAWPLPNVWLGVSTERQQEADERIPLLLQTPASIRFISAEPLLGSIDLNKHLGIAPNHDDLYGLLHWVIVGGESGHDARPMHPGWVRALRDQCSDAGVPFFFKQWGEWHQRDCVHVSRDHAIFNPDGSCTQGIGSGTAVAALRTHVVVERMGKKRAGRKLDGIEHNAMPSRIAPVTLLAHG